MTDAGPLQTIADAVALKVSLRRHMLSERDGLPDPVRGAAALALAGADLSPVLAALRVDAGLVVGGYWPIRSEIDPRPLMARLAGAGAILALPRIENGTIAFRHHDPSVAPVPAGFGTLGPPVSAALLEPDLILVPLAAFDRAGHRLGYGRGHYDGALARARGRGALGLGLAYARQEVPAVPQEPHDQPLQAILTERELVLVRPADGAGPGLTPR